MMRAVAAVFAASFFMSIGILALFLAPLIAVAQAPNLSGASVISPGGTAQTLAALAASIPLGVVFPANNQSACTWNTSNDVGPCVNAAIAAAAAAGGGTVTIPAGVYNVATTIVQGNSGVHLVGAGSGTALDNSAPSHFFSITRFVWTGTAGGTLYDEEPGGTATIWSGDVTGIVFDCAGLANICAKIASVSGSQINIGVSEPRVTGAWLTTQPSLVDAPGSQQDDIWIWSRSTSASFSPTGILIDGGQGSNFNVSGNRFWFLGALYKLGDGIVLGNNDSNQFYSITAVPSSGATGTPVIIASPGYVMPSGGTVSTPAQGSNDQFYNVTTKVTVQGYVPSSTLTPGVGNLGTAAVTPVTLVTNSATSGGAFMNYASTTGVGSWMDFSCTGGSSSNVPNHDTVFQVTPTTIRPIYLLGNPASGLSCTFSWGLTQSAPVSGTYTITATGPTTYNITAPAGGHSQSGISVSGGVLTFTDVVIPLTGSATTGDTFTLVVGGAPYGMNLFGVSSINGVQVPYFEPGSQGAYQTVGAAYPAYNPAPNGGIMIPFSSSACGNISPTVGQLSVVIGDCSGGATGAYTAAVGGTGVLSSGFATGAFAGQNNSVSGFNGFIGGGQAVTVSGNYSQAGGFNSTDRGRYAIRCYGGGAFSAQGDAQTCSHVLHGKTTTTSVARLTSDGNAAGSANCINIPNNSAYSLTITNVGAFDHTTIANNESWGSWSGLMTRGANASTTAVTMDSTPTPKTNGTVTGSSIAVSADTTNGCLNVSFTPPTSNTDTWNEVMRVETVEIQ